MAVVTEQRSRLWLPVLDRFSTVDLWELEQAKLMQRIDRKFVFHQWQLNDILQVLAADFDVLLVEGCSVQSYTTVYYDTVDYAMYLAHHNGKGDRYKIRQRYYHSSTDCFVELKHKDNKGVTHKRRQASTSLFSEIPACYADFLCRYTPYGPTMLRPVMANKFNRFTLTNVNRSQRITVDTDLAMEDGARRKGLPNLVIVEVKSEAGDVDFTIFELLRRLGVKSTSMSKYCIGLAMLNPELKQNLFKPKIRAIAKLCARAI